MISLPAPQWSRITKDSLSFRFAPQEPPANQHHRGYNFITWDDLQSHVEHYVVLLTFHLLCFFYLFVCFTYDASRRSAPSLRVKRWKWSLDFNLWAHHLGTGCPSSHSMLIRRPVSLLLLNNHASPPLDTNTQNHSHSVAISPHSRRDCLNTLFLFPPSNYTKSFCVSSRPAYSNCDECFHLPLKVSTTRAHKKTMNLPPRHDPKCEVRWVESTLVLRKLTTAGGVVCSRGNLELSKITNISVCVCCAGKWLSVYVFLIATPAHGRPQTER